MADNQRDRSGPLTPIQFEILHHISQGRTHAETGEKMHLSRDTVSQILAGSVLPKLGARKTTEATAIFGRHLGLREAADHLDTLGLEADAEYLRDQARRLLGK